MTNSNLIPVFNGSIQNTQIQLCNARELHSFVESKQDYSNWIRNRINDYGFIQDEDYIIVTERTNGRPRKEYHITLDMGKELAMVERNEKGRQIRKYFIECERRAKQPQQLALPEAEKKYTFEFSEYELQQLALPEHKHNLLTGDITVPVEIFGAIMQHTRLARRLAEKTEAFHRQLYEILGLERYIRNDIAAMAHDVRVEFNYFLDEGEKIIERHRKEQSELSYARARLNPKPFKF